jgi:F-type H+-transporting ATPase subunit b
MLSVDQTLIIQIANFLILLFLLNIFLYKPIRGILAKRSEAESGLQSSIDDFQFRADENERGVEEGKVQARKEGTKEKESLKGLGLEKEQGIVREAMSAAEEKIGNARKDVDAKMADVKKSLEKQVAVFSTELAEKILGRSV